MQRPCQTVAFNEDWHIIDILRVFNDLGDKKVISQEELMRKTGLNLYALRSAIKRISDRINDSIVARPENESMDQTVLRWWHGVDDLFLWKGKFTFNERRALGYKLADNVEILSISSHKVILRVYKNGN